ncbi:MAG: pyridoxamine 5'-phosphate oxidase family protein [Dongiaceae bacterium]
MTDEADDICAVPSQGALRDIMGTPMELAVRKQLGKLDRYCREFIARSPFLCIGTADGNGNADVSPRGDPPGFVQVLDDNTLIIPDRPGNNRLDTMSNIMENPNVGLLFFIPGFEDTLRVNGRATIVRDPAALARAAVNGKAPKVVIRVAVDEAFLHCAKAFKRSRLWDPASRVERKEMPSLAKMILEQTAPPATPPTAGEVAAGDEFVEQDYKTGMY